MSLFCTVLNRRRRRPTRTRRTMTPTPTIRQRRRQCRIVSMPIASMAAPPQRAPKDGATSAPLWSTIIRWGKSEGMIKIVQFHTYYLCGLSMFSFNFLHRNRIWQWWFSISWISARSNFSFSLWYVIIRVSVCSVFMFPVLWFFWCGSGIGVHTIQSVWSMELNFLPVSYSLC